MNRRENPRIDVRLKCYVASSGGSPEGCVGETQNISRSGVLVLWQACNGMALPQPGDPLTLEIELPAHHEFSRKCIHCQGTVVRVTTGNNEVPQVAVSVNYMKFREYVPKRDARTKNETQVGSWST